MSRITQTTDRNLQPPSNEPMTGHDTERYQSAKGCFMLSLFTVASGVICALVGYGIHLYIEATTRS